MTEKTQRIYEKELSDNVWKENLFWIREGRAYYFEGRIISEKAARGLRFLEELLPSHAVTRVDSIDVFSGTEECFYIEEKTVILVRQIGKVKIGNVRLWSKKVRRFLGMP